MIGITSITFRNKSVERVVEFAKRANVDCIEWGSDFHVLPSDTVAAENAAKLCESSGINICSYGTYYVLGKNMNFDDYLDSCVAMRCHRMRIWAGSKSSSTISKQERISLVEECQKISDRAAEHSIELCFEYHRNTLTDTKESAADLITSVDRDNVFTYWQPNPEIEEREKYEEIEMLRPYIKTIHFFNWKGKNTRFLMSEGKNRWKEYIKHIDLDVPYLLEFTLDDDDENAISDINTMKDLLM
jgi:sugar phosphate isomerase/epimerase